MALSVTISFPDERLASVQGSSPRKAGLSAAEYTVSPVFVSPKSAPVALYLQVVVRSNGATRVVQTAYLQLHGSTGRVSLVDCTKSVATTHFESQLANALDNDGAEDAQRNSELGLTDEFLDGETEEDVDSEEEGAEHD